MAIKYEVGLKTKIALEDYEIEQKLDSKMERYVMRLVKNPDNTFKLTSLDDSDLSFNEVYNITKKLNEYVVVVYGSSKLRPQYVSTNEMMFIGVDRSTETKILRILYTPTRLTYETFKVVEQPQLDDISSQIANIQQVLQELKEQGIDIDTLEQTINEYLAEHPVEADLSKLTLTYNDNILRLMNGNVQLAQVVIERGQNVLWVTTQNGGIKVDKTFNDIKNAYDSGNVIILVWDGSICSLSKATSSAFTFNVFENNKIWWFTVKNDNTCTYDALDVGERELSSNKTSVINDSNKASTTSYTSNKAVVDYVESAINNRFVQITQEDYDLLDVKNESIVYLIVDEVI